MELVKCGLLTNLQLIRDLKVFKFFICSAF